jgi:hypothetical protein
METAINQAGKHIAVREAMTPTTSIDSQMMGPGADLDFRVMPEDLMVAIKRRNFWLSWENCQNFTAETS